MTAYIPIPDLNPADFKLMLAKELDIDVQQGDSAGFVLDLLQKKLMALNSQGKKIVVLIDEAQTMSDESLESLRLLSNLEAETHKLIHIILFAQPELDERLNKKHLRQLHQRITFSHYLKTMTFQEMEDYVRFRVIKSGSFQYDLFNTACMRLLFKHSEGVPRVVNTLCHKSLLSAYGRGITRVQRRDILSAIKDAAPASIQTSLLYKISCLALIVILVVFIAVCGFLFFK